MIEVMLPCNVMSIATIFSWDTCLRASENRGLKKHLEYIVVSMLAFHSLALDEWSSFKKTSQNEIRGEGIKTYRSPNFFEDVDVDQRLKREGYSR